MTAAFASNKRKMSTECRSTLWRERESTAEEGESGGGGERESVGGKRERLIVSLRDQKWAALLKEKRASSGSTGSPRVITLFSLAQDILSLLSSEASWVSSSTVASSEYKLRATVLKAPHGDMQSCIEMAKV
ncbi:hypothetical protein L484_016836 [Morus notabilis]|uniref:Uncharacterized protein n=1 Tax=Morus notabilis TaxID=981085 RepID=W9R019_9ROSA|nr:hypothetical protein L484_016836 [Morus notabilis]